MLGTLAVKLSIWFRWTNLRAVGNSAAVKSTILIPVCMAATLRIAFAR